MICAFGATFLSGTFALHYIGISLHIYHTTCSSVVIATLLGHLLNDQSVRNCRGLIAALMITGLGDATWKYIPWRQETFVLWITLCLHG